MNELIETYLQIPSERLGTLLDNDFNNLYKIHKETREKWIKEKKCFCVENLKEGRILRCIHLRKEIKKQSKKISMRIEAKTSILTLRSFLNFQRYQNRMQKSSSDGSQKIVHPRKRKENLK